MGHKVGVDQVDDSRVDISDLKQGVHLRFPGTAIDPDHVRHPPVLPVFNDHGHARTDVEEHGI